MTTIEFPQIERFVTDYFQKDMTKGRVRRVQGNYRVSEDGKRLYYNAPATSTRFPSQANDTIAITLDDGRKIGNASRYARCGRGFNSSLSPVQAMMLRLHVPMLPFSVFAEAQLDINQAKIIEQGAEEKLMLPRQQQRWNGDLEDLNIEVDANRKGKKPTKPKGAENFKVTKLLNKSINKYDWEAGYRWHVSYIDTAQLLPRHYVGAMLIKCGDACFLFDCDRQELKHYRFNPFLVQLPKAATTIKEAYEMLKPEEVRQAERKGLNIVRQGEWFFIPADAKLNRRLEGRHAAMRKWLHGYEKLEYGDARQKASDKFHKTALGKMFPNDFIHGVRLQAGVNRPNTAQKAIMVGKTTYVSGLVEHMGREHEPRTLKAWCKPVPNKATKSFTITGGVD